MKKLKFVLLVAFAFSMVGCFSYSKFLSNEGNMLRRVATSKVNGTQKIDSLLASSVRLMEVALKPINPVKGGKVVAKYFDKNETSLNMIVRDLDQGFGELNMLQQGAFVLNLSRKSYAKDFIRLYPKFRRKYKTVKTAAKFMGFMGKSIGGMGKLAFLLG